jgi:hypothetical protein
MREYFQRLVGRGMKKIKALIAVARKLLGIMFALVRDNSKYQLKEVINNSETGKVPA